jgi:superfamily II DNA or RNA helicase
MKFLKEDRRKQASSDAITGLWTEKDRQNSIAKFANGEVQVIIGTHVTFRGANFGPPAVSILSLSMNNRSEVFCSDGGRICFSRDD